MSDAKRRGADLRGADLRGATLRGATLRGAQVLCIGIGNEFRTDDRVGLAAVRALQAQPLPGVTFMEQSGEGTSLMAAWEGVDTVLLVDAVSSGGEPGTIYRLDAHDGAIPASFFNCSSHNFGVAEAIELARTLGQLPPRLVVYGVEGADFGMSVELSPPVAAIIESLLDRLRREILALQYGE